MEFDSRVHFRYFSIARSLNKRVELRVNPEELYTWSSFCVTRRNKEMMGSR